MTGTMLISASISSLRPWQMEQTLALTPNRLRSTVLSHWSEVWILNQREKLCTRPTISTRLFSSKVCLTFRTIFREPWLKTNFGILTLTPPQWLQTMRRTPECRQGHFCHTTVRQLKLLSLWNCSARRQRNDFPKRWNSSKDCRQ